MRGKRGNSPKADPKLDPKLDPKAEPKNPDRRHLLGAAAAAAFTVGPAGAAMAATHPKKPPVHRPKDDVMCPVTPPSHGSGHGGHGRQGDHGPDYPGALAPIGNHDVIVDAQAYRQAVTQYALNLRMAMGLNDNKEFQHMVRIKSLKVGDTNLSADCGCGCS
jgi:hypothetical protein